MTIRMQYGGQMGVTVQVRDLDPEVQVKLRDAAAREGLSLSAFLRRELTRLSEQFERRARVERLGKRNRLGMPIGYVSTEDAVAWIREDRGE